MRIGRLALLGGAAVFLVSMGAREVLAGLLRGVPQILDEGLIFLAWLALWRPAEMLAYEWVPIHRKRRLYERLAGIRVSVRIEAGSNAPAGAHLSSCDIAVDATG
jgi:hypothetical protein